MTYQSASELRYIEALSDLPIIGPDLFPDSEKLAAAAIAETKLEADTNDGFRFADEEVTPLHREAAGAYASYRLFVGPEHPEDINSGQLQGGAGEDTMEFATELKNQYQSHVASIEDSGEDDSRDAGNFIISDGSKRKRTRSAELDRTLNE
jgi:hypothetical protein